MTTPYLPAKDTDASPLFVPGASSPFIARGIARLARLTPLTERDSTTDEGRELWWLPDDEVPDPWVAGVVGDVLVVRSGTSHAVCGVDARSGTRRWMHDLRSAAHRHSIQVAFGCAYVSESCGITASHIWPGRQCPAHAMVSALDAYTGSLLWARPGHQAYLYGTTSSPDDVSVIVHAGEVLQALDPMTGEARWKVPVIGYPAFKESDDVLFLTDDNGLRAINLATGQPEWTFSPGGPIVFRSRWQDVVLAESYDEGRTLFSLDSISGKERWRFDERSGPFVVNMNYIADPVCVWGESSLFAMDARDFRERWRMKFVETWPFFGNVIGNVYPWNDDGLVIQRFDLCLQPDTPPDPGRLSIVRRTDGEELWRFPFEVESGIGPHRLALIPESVLIAVIMPNGQVTGFPGAGSARPWTVLPFPHSKPDTTRFASVRPWELPLGVDGHSYTPAAANRHLVVFDGQSLGLIDGSTGRLVWRWSPQGNPLPKGHDELHAYATDDSLIVRRTDGLSCLRLP